MSKLTVQHGHSFKSCTSCVHCKLDKGFFKRRSHKILICTRPIEYNIIDGSVVRRINADVVYERTLGTCGKEARYHDEIIDAW